MESGENAYGHRLANSQFWIGSEAKIVLLLSFADPMRSNGNAWMSWFRCKPDNRLCRLITDCRLSLRESSAAFAERKATISTTPGPLGWRPRLLPAAASRLVAWLSGSAITRNGALLAILVTLITPSLGMAGEPDPVSAAEESITAAELKNHVNFLASDTLEGREAGTHGGYAAAAYIVQALRKLEVQPGGQERDFYQYFHPNYRNVLAVLPGSDPKLKDEHVLIGAHYDHVGYGNRNNSRGTIGRIHNGADDNASGTAGILEVIEALAGLDKKPRRSILVAFWDGEEEGLLGSKFYVSYPTVPLRQIRLHVKIDMIGRLRPESFEVFGWRTAPGLRRMITRHNDGLHINFKYDYLADSDHWPFYQHSVPSLMLHTGKHDDYHTSKDDAPLVNIKGLRQVSQYLLRMVLDSANADVLPDFREQSWRELQSVAHLPERQSDPERAPSRLGIKFDSELSDQNIVRVTRLTPDGPADAAGLKVDDEIIEFAGVRVSDVPDFRLLVAAASSPVSTLVRREEEELEIEIQLRGEPTEWGFEYRRDSAEPDSIVVTAVTAAGPGDLAGLKRGDRIHSLSQELPEDNAELKQWLRESTGPLSVDIERDGKLSTLMLRRVVVDE